jgi:hypothetical protein
MSTNPNKSDNLAYSTRCLPGSPAEKKEEERLAQFHRDKALRQAQEAENKAQKDAERERKHLLARQALEQSRRSHHSR